MPRISAITSFRPPVAASRLVGAATTATRLSAARSTSSLAAEPSVTAASPRPDHQYRIPRDLNAISPYG